MPATVIDGKALAAATKAEAAEKVRELKSRGINPCLAVILVGENPASQVYVRGKINDCAQCGIESRSINLPADTTQDALLAEVKKLADDSAVHGILVQLPLPAQIDEKAVIDAIPPEKDVDGFSPVNVGRMQIGEPCYLPCTPAGCIRMIESTGTDIAGKNAVVIGRSNIVGKPAALLLLAKNATVTICHSRTKNLKEVCAAADILVAAVGREGFVTGDMVKPGAVVIDVGINRGADGKLHGDVNFAEAAEKACGKDFKPDAVMLDVVLPSGGGKKVYETLRKKDRRLKVVFMSGSAPGEEIEKILEQDRYTAFLDKPCRAAQAVKTLQILLAKA